MPGYKTDAIYRVENMDRYDDRLIVENNLIKSYDLLMGFIAKHTNDNASAFPAKLIIDKDKYFPISL